MSTFGWSFGTPGSSVGFLPGGTQTVAVGNQGGDTIGEQSRKQGGSFIDLVRDLTTIGKDIYVTKVQGEIAENQVAAGMYPSVAVDSRGNLTPAGLASAAGISTNMIMIVGAIVLLVLLLRR